MGISYHFLEAPGPDSEVLRWFRRLPEPPEETVTPRGFVLFFRNVAQLPPDDPEGAESPVVTIWMPQVRRATLWTTGAVHFLTTPISRFAKMAGLHRSFKAWITSQTLVHDPKRGAENIYDYYLEGAAANRVELYGLRSGMEALEGAQYFVDPLDNEAVLDRVCRSLRLRGVVCAPG